MSKDDVFENSLPSSKNASNFPKTRYLCTPLKFRTVVSRLSPNANLSDTSCSMVWPCEEHAMVFCDSSWKAVPRDARSWYPGNSAQQEQRA